MQALGIYRNTVALNARKHFDQRQLNIIQHLRQTPFAFDLGTQRLLQPQGNINIFAGVRRRLFQGDLVKGQLLGALTSNLFKGDGLFTQILERQRIHIVAGGGGVEHIGGQHGVGKRARHGNCVVGQHGDVVLKILANFGFFRVFQQRL